MILLPSHASFALAVCLIVSLTLSSFAENSFGQMDSSTVQSELGESAMNLSSTELGLYQYGEYGIGIRYPTHWIVEPFAFYDKHLPGFHPGHLPGLPLQVLQPTQLDMLKFDTQQAIVGFYAPTDEVEQVSAAGFVVLVEKVSGTNSLFSNPLDNYVKSFVFENTDPNFPYRNNDVQARVLELYEGNVGGNKAIIVVL